jgi:hypothetical protein
MVPFTNARSAAFPLFAAAALALLAVMNWIGAPLTTPAAPTGIISFELAGSPQDAAAILASWDLAAQRQAAFSLGLDYVFMLAYASAIGLAAVKAGKPLARYAWPLSGWGHWVGWGAWLAALLDAIENAALAKILLGGAPLSPWPQLAAVCAAAKFTLIFLALVYVFYALAAVIAARLSP